jgi:hypothetical protein
MATDSVMGLFASPEQIQQQQYQQAFDRNLQLARLNPRERNVAMLGTSVDRLGSAVGGALGGQDPQLQAATAVQQLAGQFDLSTSAGNLSLANALRERNLLGPASQFANKAATMRKDEASAMPEKQRLAASLADTMAQRGTPEWMKSYQESLAEVINPEKLSTNEKDFRAAQKGGYQGTFNDWILQKTKAGATNVSVSTGENAYGTEFGKGIAGQDLAKYNLAQKAPDILAAADSTEKLLNSNKVFTGTGASAKLNVLALGQGLGVTGKNADEIIANTQQLQQQRSQAVLSQIKARGLGTGQGFTDKDLKFLQDSAAGSITLSKETLQRQVNIERKIARAAAKDWNTRLGSMPQKVVGPMGLSSVSVPDQTAFESVEEAMAAKLPKGTKITVNGRPAEVQ